MTEEQKLLKETLDLCTKLAMILTEDKLAALKEYIALESKVTKLLADAAVGKVNLFDKPVTPVSPIIPAKDPLFADDGKRPVDPLSRKELGNFDHLPEPKEVKKDAPVVSPNMRLPWESEDNEPITPAITTQNYKPIPTKKADDDIF